MTAVETPGRFARTDLATMPDDGRRYELRRSPRASSDGRPRRRNVSGQEEWVSRRPYSVTICQPAC